jgi:hypothetical protein
VRPSWFAESLGHYEGGDSLVVDTIGLQAHNSFLDWFGAELMARDVATH